MVVCEPDHSQRDFLRCLNASRTETVHLHARALTSTAIDEMSNTPCSIAAHVTSHSLGRLHTDTMKNGVSKYLLVSVGNTVDTPVSPRQEVEVEKSYHNTLCAPTPRPQHETLGLIECLYEFLPSYEKLRVDGVVCMATNEDECRIAHYHISTSTRLTKP